MSDLNTLKESLLATIEAIKEVQQFQKDGRKYDVGDKVEFTDDDGNQVPGVIHGVRYQKDEHGTHHSFEYIVVHEKHHRAWWDIVGRNDERIAAYKKAAEKHNPKSNKPHPELEELEAVPPMPQYVRVFEED